MTECILHIGVEKTGSTSIQSALSKNRQKLLSHGVLYPRTLGEKSHIKAYALASESGMDEVKSQSGFDSLASIESARLRLLEQLADEISSNDPKIVCISNEHCSSRLLLRSEIRRLATLVQSFCDNIKVVIYLRRQGDALRSAYSTYVKTGGTAPFALPGPEAIEQRYDYEAIIARWAEVFGEGAMDVRLFDRDTLKDGDVVADFVASLGIEPLEFILDKEMNKSLGSVGLEFLRAFNSHVSCTTDNALNPLRGNIQELVEQFTSGAPYAGDVAIMNTFDDVMRESNARVASRYFPNRGKPLFPPHTRQGVADAATSLDSVMSLMAQIWEAKQQQVLQLRSRVAKLTGRN